MHFPLIEKGRDRKRKLHLLINSSNVCNGRGWPGPTPGARGLNLGLPHWSEGRRHLNFYCCLLGSAFTGGWTPESSVEQRVCISAGILAIRPNTHPSFFSFLTEGMFSLFQSNFMCSNLPGNIIKIIKIFDLLPILKFMCCKCHISRYLIGHNSNLS